LVPRKALLSVRKLADEHEEGATIEFSQDDSHVFFTLGSRLLTAQLLTGQFPNYETVLAKENGKVAELNREALEAVVQRVSLLADDRLHGIRLALGKNRLEVSASSLEYGEAKEVLEAQYGHEGVQITFNAEYLLEFLGAVDATTSIRMQVKDAESAAQFRPSGNNQPEYTYVLMPLRL
jgi:DNA polymerase-3 subunit beta